MLQDGRRLRDGEQLECDVCIIGGGPAGLTLATELLRSRLRVVVIESGGAGTQAPGNPSAGLEFHSPHFLSPEATLRYQLGGMANAWDAWLPSRKLGARFHQLDPIDFESRSWLPFSGWPLSHETLAPWYQRARVLCGLTGPDRSQAAAASSGQNASQFIIGDMGIAHYELASRTPFTQTLPRRLARNATTTLVLNSTVTRLETDGLVSRVKVAHVSSGGGRSFVVRARDFVLASGAIGNARLLLASGGTGPGLGNGHDLVGRFYMDHPYVITGFLTPRDPHLFNQASMLDLRTDGGVLVGARLRLSEAVMRRERLLNAGISLEPRPNEAFLAAQAALRRLRRTTPSLALSGQTREELRTLLGATPLLLSTALRLALLQRRLRPSLSDGGWSRLPNNQRRFGYFTVIVQPEQAPKPDNRVTLTQDVDELGMPGTKLEWRWSDSDLESISRLRSLLAREFVSSGLGSLDLDGPKLALELERAGLSARSSDSAAIDLPTLMMPQGGHHHLGTTRMHPDPSEGVVDGDCLVHGMENLFVAGGSVFPTSGYANPTLTIIALSIRLADHISRGMGTGDALKNARTADPSSLGEVNERSGPDG